MSRCNRPKCKYQQREQNRPHKHKYPLNFYEETNQKWLKQSWKTPMSNTKIPSHCSAVPLLPAEGTGPSVPVSPGCQKQQHFIINTESPLLRASIAARDPVFNNSAFRATSEHFQPSPLWIRGIFKSNTQEGITTHKSTSTQLTPRDSGFSMHKPHYQPPDSPISNPGLRIFHSKALGERGKTQTTSFLLVCDCGSAKPS